MKAAVYTSYGPPEVLKLQKVAKPAPKDHEVLIRVYATTVTATDCYQTIMHMPHPGSAGLRPACARDARAPGNLAASTQWFGSMMRRGEPAWGRIFLGFRKPRKQILGIEVAGVVESTGKAVRHFRQGDQVCGATMLHMSGCAEYLCLPETAALVIKPVNMTYEEAAAFPDGALTALTFLHDIGKTQHGQQVLIYGASGSVGTFAVQLARYFGASVTGVCSTTNVDMVKSLGVTRVIDYTREDFTRNGERYDIIFDTAGRPRFRAVKARSSKGGSFLPVQ